MIVELNKEEYYKISYIADQCKNIEVRAVVQGNNPGRVYVDRETEPTAALIWIQGQQGFQIVGDPQSEGFLTGLNDYMITHVEPVLKKQNISVVEMGANLDTWDSTISTIFNNRNVLSDIQHVFYSEGNLLARRPDLSDPPAIHRIDRDLLESRRLDNHSFLEKKLLHFWDSMDAFLQQGFGYYVEEDNNLVSLCFSAFVAGQTHAIDIETIEGYRKRNYGVQAATAYVKECSQKGIQPYWDCSPDNTGSIRIAEGIGMIPDFDYRIFWYGIT
ncbi:GNAT family N-acetyltransferase [Paenibacillus solani]|uniref:Acyl-CoA thioesterase n=1 Tax=Paenibacillus solani TaxID=1705565 RepID=A0A0M1P8J4_9BACL|nr:GNAT family N-acetyltransferase [Paenibacillus solani]KOR90752.1 acyl-CoA thioesterase [Paenibacillus solani]